MELPVPAYEEQSKIVEAYKIVEDRIKLKRKMNDKLFVTINSFFIEKFGSLLCEEMRNSPHYVQLNRFMKVKHGYAFDGELFSQNPTSNILVSPGNFKIGGGFQNNKPKYYMDDAPYNEEFVLHAGSLVVTMTDLSKNGDTLGYPAIIPKDTDVVFLHNQRVGLIEFTSMDLPIAFIYFLMCSTDYRNYILATASGTTVRHTSPDKISKYGFIMPEKQKDLEELKQMFEVYISYSNDLNCEIKLLDKIKELLLAKLVK